MSSSCGEVRGQCGAFQRLVSDLEANAGKSRRLYREAHRKHDSHPLLRRQNYLHRSQETAS